MATSKSRRHFLATTVAVTTGLSYGAPTFNAAVAAKNNGAVGGIRLKQMVSRYRLISKALSLDEWQN